METKEMTPEEMQKIKDKKAADAKKKAAASRRAKDKVIKGMKFPQTGKLNPFNNYMKYGINDTGMGRLISDTYKEIVTFVRDDSGKEDSGIWYVFNGNHWEPDILLTVPEVAKELLADYLPMIPMPEWWSEDEKEYHKKINSYKGYGKQRAAIKSAQSVYPTKYAQFDEIETTGYLFNCASGTLDLNTGKIYKPDPAQKITRFSDVIYDKKAKYPRFIQFVEEITQGDKDKAWYIQKMLGYGMCSSTAEECMFMWYGETTRNGKDTLMTPVINILGVDSRGYAAVRRQSILHSRAKIKANEQSEDIAGLVGRRFINVAEPTKELQLDEAMIKEITGSRDITARFLNQNSFTFRVQCKFYVHTNHRPQVQTNDLFKSDRVKVVPFDRHFTEEERDITLKSQFEEPEAKSAILNWLIQGYHGYMEERLSPTPKSVIVATGKYEKDSDILGQFWTQCYRKVGDYTDANYRNADKSEQIKYSEVYKLYERWMKWQGYTFKLTSPKFALELNKRQICTGNLTGNVKHVIGYIQHDIEYNDSNDIVQITERPDYEAPATNDDVPDWVREAESLPMTTLDDLPVPEPNYARPAASARQPIGFNSNPTGQQQKIVNG